VFDGRVDNRQELYEQLGLPYPLETLPDSRLVFEAWKALGRRALKRLLGEFSFAVWDEKQQELYIARDALGVRPLYYAHTSRFLAFASQIKGLRDLPGINLKVDETWVADYLTLSHFDREVTIHQGIKRLPGGHCLTVQPSSGKIQIERYWRLEPVRGVDLRTAKDCHMHFRGVLEEAVRCRMRDTGPLATLLSGGLDSSAVTSLAYPIAEKRGQQIHAFSSVLPEGYPGPEIDERSHILRMLDRYSKLIWTPVYADGKDILSDLDRMILLFGQPTRDAFHYRLLAMLDSAKAARARTVLTGMGGDFFASRRVTETAARLLVQLRPQLLLAHYRRERKLSLSPSFIQFCRARLAPPLLGSTRLHQALATLGILDGRPTFALSPGLGRRTGFNDRLRRTQRQLSRNPLRPVLDYEEALASSGSTAQVFEHFAALGIGLGLNLSIPLMDQRIVSAVASYPQEVRHFGSRNRLLLRQAMKGVLPPRIRLRHDKGPFCPDFARRLKQCLLRVDVVERYLTRVPELDSYIDQQAVKTAINNAPEFGVGLYQNVTELVTVWTSVMLAAWMHAETASRAIAPATENTCDISDPTNLAGTLSEP